MSRSTEVTLTDGRSISVQSDSQTRRLVDSVRKSDFCVLPGGTQAILGYRTLAPERSTRDASPFAPYEFLGLIVLQSPLEADIKSQIIRNYSDIPELPEDVLVMHVAPDSPERRSAARRLAVEKGETADGTVKQIRDIDMELARRFIDEHGLTETLMKKGIDLARVSNINLVLVTNASDSTILHLFNN